MPDNQVWSTIAGGLIAAIAGACGSIYTDLSRDRSERQKERSRVRSVLSALHAELTVVWEHYSTEIGPTIAEIPPGQGLYMTYPIYHNYFIVFDSHVDAIGALGNSDLSRNLVRGYVLAKGMLDNLKFNNSLVKKLEDADPRAAENPQVVNLRNELRAVLLNDVIQYGPVLQKAHARLSGIIPPLLDAMQAATKDIEAAGYSDLPLHTLLCNKFMGYCRSIATGFKIMASNFGVYILNVSPKWVREKLHFTGSSQNAKD